jgi:uncharacterized protein
MYWKNSKKQLFSKALVFEILDRVATCEGHKVIVGTDSVKLGSEFIFANAICIINDNAFYDRRFFYHRKNVKNDVYYDLSRRLLKETTESLDIAMSIKEKIEGINIEIHADVNSEPRHMSSKYMNMITGYITGCGFSCEIKPNSFVASGIADIYTRKK